MVVSWSAVASERKADATALRAAARGLASIYMLGYVAECRAKELIVERKKTVPREHDLLALLKVAGIRPTQLSDELRETALRRDVAMRYEIQLPSDRSADEHWDELNRLIKYVQKLIYRANGSTRRRF